MDMCGLAVAVWDLGVGLFFSVTRLSRRLNIRLFTFAPLQERQSGLVRHSLDSKDWFGYF